MAAVCERGSGQTGGRNKAGEKTALAAPVWRGGKSGRGAAGWG